MDKGKGMGKNTGKGMGKAWVMDVLCILDKKLYGRRRFSGEAC